MSSTSQPAVSRGSRAPSPPPDYDHFVRLHDVSWSELEQLLAIRGDAAGTRIAYLEGELELMSPSRSHERLKTVIARLLESYAVERGLELNGFGSWTVKNEAVKRALEPDECYVLGAPEKDVPDLAIEVRWTTGGIEKLPIYAGLGVAEVWVWIDGRIDVYELRDGAYVQVEGSLLLPDLDLDLLLSFLEAPSQTQAVRAYVEALRKS